MYELSVTNYLIGLNISHIIKEIIVHLVCSFSKNSLFFYKKLVKSPQSDSNKFLVSKVSSETLVREKTHSWAFSLLLELW